MVKFTNIGLGQMGASRKRLLVVGKYYAPFEGGIESNTRYVSEGAAREFDVSVICFNHVRGFSREIMNGVNVVRYPFFLNVKSQPISISIIFAIVFERAEIIHFHAPNVVASLALCIKLALCRRVKLVITHHMDIFDRPLLRRVAMTLYGYLIERASSIIVTSKKNALISNDMSKAQEVVEIPLGIDLGAYRLSAGEIETAMRWREMLAPGAKVVGYIGRHARYKGLDVLVRAIATMEGVHAIIGGDGPFRASVEALVADLGVRDRVHFVGTISHAEKLRLLAAIDVFAFPSTEITEAFGISQLEAMAVGAPVVATDLPTGVTDIAVHDYTALVVAPSDHVALAAALLRIITDRELSQRLSANAKIRVEAVYTNEIMSKSTVDVLLGAVAA